MYIHGVRDIEIFKTFLSRCKDICELDCGGLSLLHLAIKYLQWEVAHALLQQGFKVNIKSRDRYTPLVFALANDSFKVVELLLDNGAAIVRCGPPGAFRSCLLNSVSNAQILKLLHDRGVDNWGERTSCVLTTVRIPRISTIIPTSLRNNFETHILDQLTPVHHLAYKGKIEVLEYLTEHKSDIDINVEATQGITPLFLATAAEKWPMVAFLLSDGADVHRVYTTS